MAPPPWAGRLRRLDANSQALTARALATIEDFRGKHETFEFPSRSRKAPVLPFDVNHWVRAARDRVAIKDFVPHDLRHTVATSLARMGVREEVIARVLNHAAPFPTTARYTEHKYDSEKRRALEAWERYLLEIAGEANQGHSQRSREARSRPASAMRRIPAQDAGPLSARRIVIVPASARFSSR